MTLRPTHMIQTKYAISPEHELLNIQVDENRQHIIISIRTDEHHQYLNRYQHIQQIEQNVF